MSCSCASSSCLALQQRCVFVVAVVAVVDNNSNLFVCLYVAVVAVVAVVVVAGNDGNLFVCGS